MTSFIGRRLYPAPLDTPLRHGQASLVNSSDAAGADSPHDRPHPSPSAASVARPECLAAAPPGGGCPRKQATKGRAGGVPTGSRPPRRRSKREEADVEGLHLRRRGRGGGAA